MKIEIDRTNKSLDPVNETTEKVLVDITQFDDVLEIEDEKTKIVIPLKVLFGVLN